MLAHRSAEIRCSLRTMALATVDRVQCAAAGGVNRTISVVSHCKVALLLCPLHPRFFSNLAGPSAVRVPPPVGWTVLAIFQGCL